MSLLKDLIEGGAGAVKALQIEESATLDYKRDFPKKHREFAKDVTAFANTEGGLIIYGVEEKNHRPVAFPGVKISADILREKENVIESSVMPPLRIKLRPVPLEDKGDSGFLLVDIPRSFDRPHMVEVKDEYRYYGRRDFSSTPMTDYKVAGAFEVRMKSQLDTHTAYESILKDLRPLPKPRIAIIACPIPPVAGTLPVFGAERPEEINRMAVILTDTPNPNVYREYIEFGKPGSTLAYIRFYYDGCIAFLDLAPTFGVTPKALHLGLVRKLVAEFIEQLLPLFSRVDKIRLPFVFYVSSEGMVGMPMIKSAEAFRIQTEIMFGPRKVTRELYAEEIEYLTNIEDDTAAFITRIMAPIEREFGIDR